MLGRESRTVDVLCVGGGLAAQVLHLPVLAKDPRVGRLYCVERQALRVAALRARFGDRVVPVEQHQVLDLLPVDLAVVATEDASHAELAAALVGAGCNVFVEKPLALTASSADGIAQAARTAGRHLFVGYQRLWDPALELARDALRAYGPPPLVHMHDVCHDNGAALKRYAPWTQAPSFADGATDQRPLSGVEQELVAHWSGGSPLVYRLFLNLCCHDLSVLCSLFRDVAVENAVLESEAAMAAHFRAGETLIAFEAAVTRRPWFDQRLRMDWPDTSLEVLWPSPFDPGRRFRFGRMWDAILDTCLAAREDVVADAADSLSNALAVARVIDDVIEADLVRLARPGRGVPR